MTRALLPLLLVLLPAVAGAGEISPLLRRPPALTQSSAFAPAGDRVTIRLAGPADPAALEALRRAGATPALLPSGGAAVVGPLVSARVPRARLEAVAAVPGVVRLEPARPTLRRAPLDRTAAQVQAPALWWPSADELAGRALGNIGEGVIVADHEGGWDPFHPDFFRPDGGHYDFEDVNHDGVAGEGDRVDLDGDGVFEGELSLLEGLRSDDYTGEVEFHDEGYQPDVDWLWVDVNQNGKRDFGARKGFGDDVPAFGEPIFAADDADGSGAIEPGEKLLRLGTSKVQAISLDLEGIDTHLYRRGVDLSAFPVWKFDDESRGHGTGAIGIVVAGWPGVRRYTGLAPGAELVLVGHDDAVSSVAAAGELGAQVDFYEYDEFIAPHDGSSAAETAISEAAAAGRVQVTAAGNLAGADHCIELAPLGGQLQKARFSTDGYYYYEYHVVMGNLTWTGAPEDVSWALVDADGVRFEPGTAENAEGTLAGLHVSAWTQRTDRGNTWVTFLISNGFNPISKQIFTLEVRATGAAVPRFRGLLTDDQSGWGKGVSWLDHRTDAGTALSPSTSDKVIAVAAHGGNHDFTDWGWGGVGERRHYSGMGPRLDGAALVDISGPDDPYSPRSDSRATHGAYGSFGGTSGALPHVAASAALILAERPALGHDAVEQLLKDGALHDSFTGDAPSEAYGHGKVRVARALGKEPRAGGEAPRLSLSVPAAVAGHRVEVAATAEGEGAIQVAFDVGNDGVEERAAGVETRFEFTPERPGRLAIAARAIDPAGRQTRAVQQVEVAERCEVTGCADGLTCRRDGLCGEDDGGGDGGGCSTAGGADHPAWLLPLLAVALFARRRRG